MKKLQNEKGFTLVELMIVVAIIGILAAIAIPQFNSYRMKGFNASAQSDLKNSVTSQAAISSTAQHFGTSQQIKPVSPPACTPAAGVELVGGGLTAGDIAVLCTQLTGAATGQYESLPLGNNVAILVQTNSVPAGVSGDAVNYAAITKHTNGNAAFAANSASTNIYINDVQGQYEPGKNIAGSTGSTPTFMTAANITDVDNIQGTTNWRTN